MSWTPTELDEVEDILWQAQSRPLLPPEESRLRQLVDKESPGTGRIASSHLVMASMVALGARLLYDRLEAA